MLNVQVAKTDSNQLSPEDLQRTMTMISNNNMSFSQKSLHRQNQPYFSKVIVLSDQYTLKLIKIYMQEFSLTPVKGIGYTS